MNTVLSEPQIASQVNIDFWLSLADEHRRILCPTCGEMYTHIRQAYTLMGHDAAEAKIYQGTEFHGMAPGKERRSALAIEFECEAQDCPVFRLIIQQHKGVNELKTQIVKWEGLA